LVINVVGDIGYPSHWAGGAGIDAAKAELFAQVRPILATGDLNFANLECPFTELRPTLRARWPISCPPVRLSYVLDAGFNLFSLANNHAFDAGVEGLVDTQRLLHEANRPDRPLWWAGTGLTRALAREPLLFTPPGKHERLAFLAVANASPNGGVASIYDEDLTERIRDAAKGADIVLVSVHGGTEWTHKPTMAVEKRYRELVDAGATVVIGHHPHVIQGVERYRQGLIIYSLGNFSFGFLQSVLVDKGWRLYSLMGRLTFHPHELAQVELIPCYADNQHDWTLGQQTLLARHVTPQLLAGPFAQAVLDELDRFTAAIDSAQPTHLVRLGDRDFVDLGGSTSTLAAPGALIDQQTREYQGVLAHGMQPRPATAAELAEPAMPPAEIRDVPRPPLTDFTGGAIWDVAPSVARRVLPGVVEPKP